LIRRSAGGGLPKNRAVPPDQGENDRAASEFIPAGRLKRVVSNDLLIREGIPGEAVP
jgi:hypothetical protein